jgi:hypothetical protein
VSAMPTARAGHEPNPQAVSAVPVTIPIARPARNGPAVRAAAVRSLAAECAEWGDDNTVEVWVSILRDAHLNDNGFEIARDLDRYRRINGIDAELVEILDGASHHLWSAHDAAVAAWVASERIEPSRPIGARITVERHGVGTISGHKLEAGCYLFVPDSDGERYAGGGGIYVPYENAQAIDAGTGATEGRDAEGTKARSEGCAQ